MPERWKTGKMIMCSDGFVYMLNPTTVKQLAVADVMSVVYETKEHCHLDTYI